MVNSCRRANYYYWFLENVCTSTLIQVSDVWLPVPFCSDFLGQWGMPRPWNLCMMHVILQKIAPVWSSDQYTKTKDLETAVTNLSKGYPAKPVTKSDSLALVFETVTVNSYCISQLTRTSPRQHIVFFPFPVHHQQPLLVIKNFWDEVRDKGHSTDRPVHARMVEKYHRTYSSHIIANPW